MTRANRHGMRVVIELKRDAVPDVVLNQIYRFSPLQSTFGVNMLALDGGRPQLMTIRDVIVAFIRFREEVVTRRTKFELTKARDRAHILVGLAIAVANIDEIIALIRAAPDPVTARDQLLAKRWPARDMAPLVALVADPRHIIAEDGTITLSEEQAKAILDLRLQRLTALGRDEIGAELKDLGGKIADFLDILRSRARVYGIIRDELTSIKEQFADAAPDRDFGSRRRDGRRGTSSPKRTWSSPSPMAATSSACRSRAIARSAAAARAAPAWRRARRISSHACSSPTRTSRCCSSPRAAWPTS